MVIWYWLRFIAMRLAMVVKAVGSAELRFRFGTRGSGTKVPIETAQMISAVWSAPLERTIAFAQERICLVSLSSGTSWAGIRFLDWRCVAKLATRWGQGRAVPDCCTGRGPLIARTTGVGARKDGSVNRARFAERTMSAYRLQLEARISEPQLAKARKFIGK
jgi:hypothetical protein